MQAVRLAILTALLVLAPSVCATSDERLYVGLWAPGHETNRLTAPRDAAGFLDLLRALPGEGLRLVDVESFPTIGGRRFVGLWRPRSGPTIFEGPLPVLDFRDIRELNTQAGLRLIEFEFDREGGQRYIGLWRRGSGDERLSGPDTLEQLNARIESFGQDGLRLEDVETFVSSDTRLYRALWRPGSGATRLVGPVSRPTLLQRNAQFAASGLALRDVEVFAAESGLRYLSVFRPGPAPVGLSVPEPLGAFVARHGHMGQQGFELVDIEVVTLPSGLPEVPLTEADPDVDLDAPEQPQWLDMTDASELTVDFSPEGAPGFRIALPRSFLGELPVIDGIVILPESFCGVHIGHPAGFLWTDDTLPLVDDPVFPGLPQAPDALVTGDWRAGLQATGPVGPCQGRAEWRFPAPLTLGEGGEAAAGRGLTLTIMLQERSQLTLLGGEDAGAGLSPAEYFPPGSPTLRRLGAIVGAFERTQDAEASGICGIVGYLARACETGPAFCPLLDRALNANCRL